MNSRTTFAGFKIVARGVVLALAALPAIAFAGLEWVKTESKLTAVAGQASVVATFSFKNAGEKPVHITSVVAACDCTKTTLSKNPVPPGESGVLTAEVSTANILGWKETVVSVVADHDTARAQTLKVTVVVPEPVVISPRLVSWAVGERNDPKVVTLTAADDEMRVTDVRSSNGNFVVALKPGADRRLREISVTPRRTQDPAQTAITVTAVVGEKERKYFVYAAVRLATAEPVVAKVIDSPP